ncbi:MAG: methyltransferase domain-containing protein [Flavobacteriales bacterium]|nr:methyltransferase domain-containing protein [Flavobacteriales bacterium]
MQLDKDFWNSRYASGEMGWDIGEPSRPLKEFIDTLTDLGLRILIPGCGSAHEALYLWDTGFRNVHLIDIAPLALERFAQRVPDFPKENLICGDFFQHQGQYDLILEQTFFCALDPSLREGYARHIYGLLRPGGRLAGVMFGVPMNADRPPFGGSTEEYLAYFSPLFQTVRLTPCSNSIAPRNGSELWVEMMR